MAHYALQQVGLVKLRPGRVSQPALQVRVPDITKRVRSESVPRSYGGQQEELPPVRMLR